MDHQVPWLAAASALLGHCHDSHSAGIAAFGHQADLGILALALALVVEHMMGKQPVTAEDKGSDKTAGAAGVTAAAAWWGNELHYGYAY